jgi:hypothetical protein
MAASGMIRTRGLRIVGLAAALAACSDPAIGPPQERPDPTDPGPGSPPSYRVEPPDGRLPWPQHDPAWDEARYDSMLAELWVINNFGQYQGAPERSTIYLHSALDLVLPNGTLIRAVAPGRVVAEFGGSEYFRTMIIEDEDRPGYGWGYTHIYYFNVRPGDDVHRGTVLGRVHFHGLPHVHLSRFKLRPGADWGWGGSGLLAIHPDTFFVYADSEPPVFEGRGFRYVRNGTDSAFVAAEPGGVVTVSGDVDIVVGLRDAGEWTRAYLEGWGPEGFGNRHSVTRIEYEIAGPDGVHVSAVAFDLMATLIPAATSSQVDLTLTLYQHYESVDPPAPSPGHYNARFGFYIITNSDGREPEPGTVLDPSDRAHAWRTGATDEAGQPLFPDGEYVVTVTAYDSRGNASSRSEAVRVENGQ